MENQGYISIAVYSSIFNYLKPEYFMINNTTATKTLLTNYLKRLRIQLTDPNLITIWKIKSNDNIVIKSKILNDMSQKLKENDLLITSKDIQDEEYFIYYLSFEKGFQIKVFTNREKNESSCNTVIISKIATAGLVVNILYEVFQFPNQCILRLRHLTGVLKENENIFNLIKYSKSDEFFLEMDKTIKYNELVKIELLKKLKLDYEKKRSKSLENKYNKSNKSLSKILYHNNPQNHRKLPDLVGITTDKSSKYLVLKDNWAVKEMDDFQNTSKRSLPVPPALIHRSAELRSDNNECNPKKIDEPQINKGYPPEPILRTNALDYYKSSSSDSSLVSTSEDNSAKENHNQKNSLLIIRPDINFDIQRFSNLYEIVKYCDFDAVELQMTDINSKPLQIEFNERLFTDFITNDERKPKGPNPILGRSGSAFKTIEPSNEKKRYMVLVVKDIVSQNSICSTSNILKGDIIVDIDSEIVLLQSSEYINKKLETNTRHNIVIARLKCESKSNKKKDENINKLKSELEALKIKYSDLHHLTVDNDQLIQQLTKLLKKQEINNVLDDINT